MLKKTGFQKKILIVYVSYFLCAVLVLITGFDVYIFRTDKERAERFFVQQGEMSAERIEQFISDMQAISSQIVSNATIQREVMDAVYSEEAGPDYFVTHIDERNRVRMECASINISDNSVDQIYIYRAPDVFLRYAGTVRPESEKIYETLSSIENRKLSQFDQDTYYKILPPQPDRWNLDEKDEYVISLMRPLITTYYTQEKIAVIEVVKSYRELEEACEIEGRGTGMQLRVYENNTGNIIYPYEDGERNKQISKAGNHKEGFRVEKEKGHNMAVYTRQLSGCGWSIELSQPYFSYIEPSVKMIGGVLLICSFFILFSVVTIYFLIKKLTKPIQTLRDSLDKVTFDNMKILSDGETNDEVELLRIRFNQLLEQLKISSNMLLQSKTAELQTKLSALQAQINPHFLYNSIMAIGAAGQEAEAEKVQQMCLSDESEEKCMDQELEHIKKYLHFMKWRYMDELEYQIEVRGNISDIVVPKISFQPLIENCFTHGFYTVRPPYRIRVKAYADEKKWRVVIIDNGGGFSEKAIEELEIIKKKIDRDYFTGESGSITHNKAIMNVYARISLMYRESAYFEIKNCKQGGACVIIGGNIERENDEEQKTDIGKDRLL